MKLLALQVVAALLLTCCGSASASIANDLLSGYTMQQWQGSNGLPEETVQAFAQTRDGYLWIGTSGGLLRFDGSHFTQFSHETNPAFLENGVFSLTAGRDGTLWIGTEGGGLIRMLNGVFRTYSATDGLTDGFIRTVLEDRGGAIWIGTDNGLFTLANSHAERAVRVDNTRTLASIAVHALFEDGAGNIWAGGSRLIRLDMSSGATESDWREFRLPGKYSETRVKSILQTTDGTMWVGTVSGLQYLSIETPSRGFKSLLDIRGTVRVLRQTSDSTLWIGTIGQGAFTYRSGRLQRVGPNQPLPSGTVLSIFEDTANNIWLGTEAGMVRLSSTPVSLIPLPDASDFETISSDTDGSLWVASTRLFHIINGKPIPYVFPQLRGARVRNLFRERDGSLWIGTDGSGLFHLKDKTTEQYTTANGLTNNFVRAIMQARNGDMWVAFDEGVTRLRRETHRDTKSEKFELRGFEVRDGLTYFSVRAIVEDEDGDIWIGTDRGLNHLHGDVFQHDVATEALRQEKVWSIYASAEGDLWFGTRNGGLYHFAGGTIRHFTQQEGLTANSIYAILEDRHRQLWLSSPEGISVIDRREFDISGANGTRHISQRFYRRSNAGDIAPLYGGTQPAAAMTKNGDAWFPTNKGPVRIVDLASPVPISARLVIDQVVADGTKLSPRSDVNLSAGNSNLEISYSPIMLSSQSDLRFMYKLDKFDHEWQNASSRRVAYYTNLPSGNYTFLVRAFTPASAAAISEASLPIQKRPFFYRTLWFFALCFLVAALLLWAVHLAKVRRMRTGFKAVLEERARLAREMHDTLIQGCASVSVLLEACSSAEISDNSEQRELVDYARTQLAMSIDEARHAVWNLRAEQSDDLGAEVTKLANRISRESNIAVACEIEGRTFPIKTSAMHELLMISREALYNAVLHAAPSELTLKVVYGSREIALEVRDNGCGFDQSKIDGGHYGLIGIGERVRQLGGTFQVESVVAHGTNISIVIPKISTEAPGVSVI